VHAELNLEKSMTKESDGQIERVQAQTDEAAFVHLSQRDALDLGLCLLRLAEERGHKVLVGVDLGEQCLFRAGLPGTVSDHQYWIERKFAAVRRFGKSTMHLELLLNAEPTFAEERGIDLSAFAFVGGAIPLLVGSVLVGAIGVAGLHSHEDHRLVLDAIAAFKRH
jgi:uncharacterized protein (UPF0303 family)